MPHYLKRAWAEIHLDRLERNLEKCKSYLKPNTELMAVVKANAYGHGDNAIAPFLQTLGVKWFAVSNINEAKHLRNLGIKGDILILGYVSPENIDDIIDNNIVQTITGLEHAVSLSEACKISRPDKKVRAHIKLDTGMGRIGLKHNTIDEYADEITQITKLANIDVEGIFTHLSVADCDDEDNTAYTNKQIDLITSVYDTLKARGVSLEHIHFLNSAGATYYKDERSTLARYGIMMYGLFPNHALALPEPLEPVMELKTIVSHVKTIDAGECVSYGRTYVSEKPVKVATLTIGYADGYSRLLSSKAEVLVNGKRAKIIGRVCMDQMMIDVTDIDVKVGDTATLFGIDGGDMITPDDLADIYGTIGYEIVCGISKRVPRVIIKNDSIIDVLDQ